MINHEMEWGDDEYTALDPICTRCSKPSSVHPAEKVGIYDLNETYPDYDNRYLDVFGNIRSSEDW